VCMCVYVMLRFIVLARDLGGSGKMNLEITFSGMGKFSKVDFLLKYTMCVQTVEQLFNPLISLQFCW